MTDAECAAQQARVERLLEHWIPPLGLAQWRHTVRFERESLTDDAGDADHDSFARAYVQWQYQQFRICWNLSRVAEVDDAHLEFVVVHELMHVFLHETRGDGPNEGDWLKHEEHAATLLAKAFVWVRDAAREEQHGGDAGAGMSQVPRDEAVDPGALVSRGQEDQPERL